MQVQSGAWKNGFCLIEFFAERRDGPRAMRRALRRQSYVQFSLSNFKISRAGQSRLEESSAFIARSAVMGRHQSE